MWLGEDEEVREYEEYFRKILSDFDDSSLVKVIVVEVTKNLVLERRKLALKIVDENRDFFGEEVDLREINTGFNNSLFDVNNKYVIKIYNGKDSLDKYETEVKFYLENEGKLVCPKLYKYDKGEIVGYPYEIVEKVKGETLYYRWYKMDEAERENIIKRIVEVMRSIHEKEYEGYDWADKIKSEVRECYLECQDMFSEDDKEVISYSLKLYGTILSDNRFVFIHNDLHFDNIVIDDDREIKLIDFNDALIAPFDYDFRILYMCMQRPCKWADSEMDLYQKADDYKHIFDYVKMYYEEISKVKYIEHRMVIYTILNDIRQLKKDRLEELRDNVVRESQVLIDMFVEQKND